MDAPVSNSDLEFISADVWVRAPLEEVWSYFSDSKNLESLTPPLYGAQVNPLGPFQNGQEVEISFSPLGILLPLKWTSTISDIVATGTHRKFVDTQKKGPFKSWRHEHLFEEGAKEVIGDLSQQKIILDPPGTWIRDRIYYKGLPSIAGKIFNKWALRKSLGSLFMFRKRRLEELFKT